MSSNIVRNGPSNAPNILLLAHGAGAGIHTDFMRIFAEEASGPSLEVVRFEFPYMTLQRELKKKRAPNTMKILLQTFLDRLTELRPARIFIGGKSMGGRVASHLADDQGVEGLICLGYPFHPPGKPEKLRVAHLENMQTSTLILQGERDPFGTREQVLGYPLSEKITVKWIPDGEHSFKARKKSGTTQEANLTLAANHVRDFIEGRQTI